MNLTSRITVKRIVVVLLFALICAGLFLRCQYSFGSSLVDEFSQPATVARYLRGDIPIKDNWSSSTMFSAFIMSLFYRAFGFTKLPILLSRYVYIVFQIAVVILVCFFSRKRSLALFFGCLIYLCSTPYNVNRITYNTLSIGTFLLFCALFFDGLIDGLESSDSLVGSNVKIVLSGIALTISVLCIPHNAFIYLCYTLLVIVLIIIRRDEKISKQLIGCWFWLTIGIIFLAIPICVYFLLNGSVSEYLNNLHYILSDSEYSKGLIEKLAESQIRIVRVYWRAWLPLLIIDAVGGLFLRKKENAWKHAYILSLLVVLYAVIRFSFIYGSVSINLAIPPIYIGGVQAWVIRKMWKQTFSDVDTSENKWQEWSCCAWLIVGYAFYICEYLATDTEILSSSAVLIVAVIPALELYYLLPKKKMTIVCSIICVICLFVQRMTFVWGDDPISELNYKIEDGYAKGIVTTQRSADAFKLAEGIITKADLNYDDETLVLPMNPTYYYLIDSKCASPYVFRFEVSVEELDNYYKIHPEKIPSVIVACKNDESGNGYDIDECLQYFENMSDMGYYVYYDGDDAIILKK